MAPRNSYAIDQMKFVVSEKFFIMIRIVRTSKVGKIIVK